MNLIKSISYHSATQHLVFAVEYRHFTTEVLLGSLLYRTTDSKLLWVKQLLCKQSHVQTENETHYLWMLKVILIDQHLS